MPNNRMLLRCKYCDKTGVCLATEYLNLGWQASAYDLKSELNEFLVGHQLCGVLEAEGEGYLDRNFYELIYTSED